MKMLRKIVLFGGICIAVAILYVKLGTSSPVSLPSYSFTDGGNFIIAKGSWLSDTKLSDQAQTVQIHCQQEWGYCIETIASIGHAGGNMLTIWTEFWRIKEWGEDKISFRENNSAMCVNYNYSIDRKNQTITSTRTTKLPKIGCEEISEAPIFSHLGDQNSK